MRHPLTIRPTTLWVLALALLVALPDAASAANPKKNRKKQKRPIAMGTSGGNINNIETFVCYSGTLGALLEMGDGGSTRYFVLSNNHIIARENKGDAGEGIVQPGLAETGCSQRNNDVIAELSGFVKLKPAKQNVVDVAIAETVPEAVDAAGNILSIGIPGTEPLKAKVGLAVKKSGAGTGLTRGSVVVTNANITVFYIDDPFEDLEAISFKNQIIIQSVNNKPFNSGGDAGSLVVEDEDSCPRPVGLLMFSDQTGLYGAVNRMDKVLKAANKMKPKGKKTVVGCASTSGFEAQRFVDPAEEMEMRAAAAAQRRVERQMLRLPGVTGIGLAQDSERRPVIMVLAESDSPELRDAIPARIDGFATDVMVAGPFFDNRRWQDKAVQ